jgi:DNA helicase-2/ATP-dependent DNA helicase PcrA
VIQNPDDSISLLRIVNSPARGIGKGTLDTLEQLALETGLPLWGAIGEAIKRQLLPPRALTALKSFQQLIEDARAMSAQTFPEHLDENVANENVARYENVARSSSPANAVDETTADSAEVPSPEGAEYQSPGRWSRESGQDAPSAVRDGTKPEDATAFDPDEFENFSFNFGEAEPEGPAENVSVRDDNSAAPDDTAAESSNAFPVPTISTADILKFLIDRTGYIKLLEEEDTPEAYSRIENLRELVNAAMDSKDRGESLDQFLDHAALIADADDYDARSQITLMSLHAAKGLEFPLVFLSGLEEGLFPHSRTMLVPDDIEEERRLCYVGMTRAMDRLVLTRAVYRRRYGTDLPEASVPSRFLEEVPGPLIEELGTTRARAGKTRADALSRPAGRGSAGHDSETTHYSYEDEDQSAAWNFRSRENDRRARQAAATQSYNSIDNIAEFFASRGKKFTVPKAPVEQPTGKRGFRPGQRVRHPKYGEGTVYQREGEGEEAKITVQFPRFGLKKLVEKYAQLEGA